MEKLAIFGTGYVGLVSGVCLAQSGNHVMCVDIDEKKIERLKNGDPIIYEPGLEELIKTNVATGRLIFTTDAQKAIEENDILMFAVGTPPKESWEADLSAVYEVSKTIGKHMNGKKVIVQKSTVPPGTGKEMEDMIDEELKKRGKEIEFAVVSNPEFLKEGSAVEDFMKPDRIVIGLNESWARKKLEQLYHPFMRQGYKVVFMDRLSAELTKYAANAMLATRISFMNEMARLAEKIGADIEMVRRGIGVDPRIGKQFLYPGPGYGGSCFPKDVKAIVALARKNNVDNDLLTAVELVNKKQRDWFVEKIKTYYNGEISGKTFAIWGLAFKANTDDVRETSVLPIAKALAEAGAILQAYDPEATETFKKEYGENKNISYATSDRDVLDGADALIILTEWQQFRSPDFELIAQKLADRTIFDARNLYDPEEVTANKLQYVSIGRKNA
ncbi:MAG: UDP-glucose/GDP-mannose dehydrogenase family protein [Candidatus Moranbacteria bacterium]|nr:UDP-glucose/GDP-mannose dehydrogenase family protein [Candidatus Moranbacteria bacterium]